MVRKLMKRNQLKLSIFLLPLIAAIGLLVTACNNSEDNSEPFPAPVIHEVELDADSVHVYDSISVKFQLLNKDNLPVVTFKEGEDIFYKLVIYNGRKGYANFASINTIVGEDLFRTYSSEGKDLGLPWDVGIGNGLGTNSIASGDSICILCPAFGPAVNLETWVADRTKSFIAFAKEETRQPFSKGSYYTKFDININEDLNNANKGEKKVECRKNFIIE